MKKIINEIKEKKVAVTKEQQIHIDARDARVAVVKANIEAARLKREEQEKGGLIETKGTKLDREEKEAKDLEEASKLKVVETLSIETTNDTELNKVVEKINEIIAIINKHGSL